jgi:hypothetical protein
MLNISLNTGKKWKMSVALIFKFLKAVRWYVLFSDGGSAV